MKNAPSFCFNWMSHSLNNYISEIALSKSTPTCEAYHYDIARFFDYLGRVKVNSMTKIKPTHIVNYMSHCKAEGKSNASINRYYMAIRSYFRYLRRTKQLAVDLTEDVTPPKNQIKAVRVPTIEEVHAILEQPDVTTEKGLRNRAMLELLYSSGLRATELCSLQLYHVSAGKVMVSCGKRGKTRTVPITSEAFSWIERYISTFRGSTKGVLFQTQMRKQMPRQMLCEMVGQYAKKAGVEKVTTHTLRHACATHLLDAGADLRLIQEVLGHASISSTQRYTHLSSNKIQEMFIQFHPRKQHKQTHTEAVI